MNEGVIHIFQIDREFWSRGSQVAFWEKIKVLVLSQSDPNSDVKLAFVD
jgi:hypothetical protein